MKKIILIAVTLLLGLQANAQLVVKGGYAFGLDRGRLKETKVNATLPQNGFFAGAEYQIALPFVDGLSFLPGAYINFLFSGKDGIDGVYSTGTYTDISLSIPLYVAYSQYINDAVTLFGFAGPSLQFGLSKAAYSNYGSGQTNRMNYYSNESPYTFNRTMLLLGVGVGADLFERFRVSAGLDFGLTPFFNGELYRFSRPLQFKLGVGYKF